MNVATFSRQRVRIERRFPQGSKRSRAIEHLVRDARAASMLIDGKVVGWRLQDGTVVCIKRRYSNAETAQQDMARIRSGSAETHVPVRVYPCGECGGFHMTSQARRNPL